MTDIINLNKARKAKVKQGQKAKAEENRVLYGISTKTRKVQAVEREKALSKLEQHKRDLPAKQ